MCYIIIIRIYNEVVCDAFKNYHFQNISYNGWFSYLFRRWNERGKTHNGIATKSSILNPPLLDIAVRLILFDNFVVYF